MKDTCNFEECYFAELLDKREQCPNYIETWWKPKDGEPILLKDCAPKRITLEIIQLRSRLFGIQQAHEQQRNESALLLQKVIQVAEIAANSKGTVRFMINGYSSETGRTPEGTGLLERER